MTVFMLHHINKNTKKKQGLKKAFIYILFDILFLPFSLLHFYSLLYEFLYYQFYTYQNSFCYLQILNFYLYNRILYFFLFFSLFFLFSARARLGTRAGRALFLLPEYCKKMIYLNIFDLKNQNKNIIVNRPFFFLVTYKKRMELRIFAQSFFLL